MTLDASNINALWGSLIIEELFRNGIDYFCISPGSRSTPLTVSAARFPNAKTIIAYDERGAAFLALGYARASGKAAVLICTSGTAAANYYPAVIEAFIDQVPMIVLTADRPPELRDTGANQTIHQPNIFGKYTKWHFDLPCPDEKISPRMLLTTVNQMVYQCRRAPAGPVHLNCMFREPLAPVNAPPGKEYLNPIKNWRGNSKTFTEYAEPETLPSQADLKKLAGILNSTSRGILVAGKLTNAADVEAVSELSEQLNWPVFADITSNLRLGKTAPDLIAHFDQLLLSDSFSQKLLPQTVLHIGGQLVSKRWLQFVEKYRPQHYIVVQNHPHRYDPFHAVNLRLECDIRRFCEKIYPMIESNPDTEWIEEIRTRSNRAGQVVEEFIKNTDSVSEISLANLVSKHISPENGLFLASSMPVRDMDMYAASTNSSVFVAANRGASGIDGTLASAAGFAMGLNRPVTLVTGDLAFLHDLNSLFLLRSISQPLFIIVINNRGGGIFSFLPIADHRDVFETFFSTPHNLNFSNAAHMFGVDYFKPLDNSALRDIYSKTLRRKKTAIIEVETEREENKKLHLQLQQQIMAVLRR
jgi:2-succinyl-5-enolpyruvyl-6-hydroxy-3-cyclohexene-1-carboxylate synthase